MYTVLAPDGSVVGDLPDLPDEEMVELHRLMLRSRAFDRRALAAQRQGRLGTYAMLEGHEATQVGSAAALRPGDFVYPAYREHAVQITRGMPLEVILAYWRGLPNVDWDVHRYGMMSIAVPIASHLPHAVGHAYAARLAGRDVVTVAYFGDGGTSETDFHSGLNFAGVWRTPTVFLCQNNRYAISVPYEKQTASPTIAGKAAAYGMPGVLVDGMDVLAVYAATRQAVDRAAAGEGPTLIEAVCYRFGAHATADDARLYRHPDEEAEWLPRDPVTRFGAFLRSRGLWDDDREVALVGEAEADFDRAMAAIEARPLPGRDDIIRHASARVPARFVEQLNRLEELRGEEPSVVADVEPPLVEDPLPDGPTENWTMAEALNAAMAEAMESRPETVLLGEDVGLAGGVFRITEGLQERFGEDRVIDTPLNESGIVGAAIGIAVAGGRAIAEIQFDGFVYPAFDQIVSHLGRIRYRSRGHVGMPVVVRMPNGAGIGAHEHHCDSPEAYFAHAPGLTVVVPSTPVDAKGLLAAALDADDPVIFLEPKVLYRAGRQDVPTGHYTIPLGKAAVRRPGADVTVVTYGGMVPPTLEAAETLAAEGIDSEVIDLRTVAPWDVDAVVTSVEKTGRMLFVQEPHRTGGIGAEVVAEIAERCGYALQAPPRRIAATDAPWPQFAIERHALIGTVEVAEAIRRLVAA
jgi:pyruvate/2-oxoglutarate/acetoin dehydrogenase E1 component/TPP-dependent pyruvate/acetoin dehydrogenase alpha subunit